MPREWVGSVFRREGRETYEAKWREWGTGAWRTTKGFTSRAEAEDHLAGKRREYRQRRRGDFDEFAQHRVRPIGEHVEQFHEHLLANRKRRGGRRTEKHAAQSRARLDEAFRRMGVRTLADLSASRVDRFLASLLDGGLRPKTRNDYAATLKQFARWAEGDQRLERDPLRNVRRIVDVAGPRRRQVLTWPQVRQLAAACVQRPLQRAPRGSQAQHVEAGRRRALTVAVMFLSGLRNNEAAHLRWSWIDLAERVVCLPADVTKAARAERVPLHAGLAELLKAERRRRSLALGAPVQDSDLVVGEIVNGTPKLPRHVNDRLREDVRFLGWQAIDEAGRVLSLYALRGSFATALAVLGVPDGVVSELMRHRPATVTEAHYTQRPLTMLRDAIDRIPAEAAHVPGLFEPGAPVPAPNGLRTSDDECAPHTTTATG